MDAQAVEPQRLGLACLVFQVLHAGNRVDGFGIIGLVEHAAQVNRFAVEIDAAVTRLDGAEAAGVAATCPAPGRLRGVRFRRDTGWACQGSTGRGRRPAWPGRAPPRPGWPPPRCRRWGRRRRRVSAASAGSGAAERSCNDDGAGGGFREQAYVADVGAGPLFEPHALPDAADGPVPALFAVRDLAKRRVGKALAVVAGVDHPHDQLVVAGPQLPGDVELEGEVAAFVFAHLAAVEPDLGAIVDGAEVQDGDAGVTAGGVGEVAAVPGDAVDEAQVLKLRLPRQRNLGGAPLLNGGNIGAVVGIQLKVPGAVKRDACADAAHKRYSIIKWLAVNTQVNSQANTWANTQGIKGSGPSSFQAAERWECRSTNSTRPMESRRWPPAT